jgi:hypothetical protein
MLIKVYKKVKMKVKMEINRALVLAKTYNKIRSKYNNKIRDTLSKACYLVQVIKFNNNLIYLKNQMKIKKGFGS